MKLTELMAVSILFALASANVTAVKVEEGCKCFSQSGRCYDDDDAFSQMCSAPQTLLIGTIVIVLVCLALYIVDLIRYVPTKLDIQQ